MATKSKPGQIKPGLPLAVWLFGIGLVVLGVVVAWPDRPAASTASINSGQSNTTLDPAAAIYTDYFDAAWRAGNTTSPVLVEATYMFPELVAALNSLPVKSAHQLEISDRLALLKPNSNTLVFYVTVSSDVDDIDGLDLAAAAEVTDDRNQTYPILKWEEAAADLLPRTVAHQRAGLLAADLSSKDGQAFDPNKAGRLTLALKDMGNGDQSLAWDLTLLKSFLTAYGRN